MQTTNRRFINLLLVLVGISCSSLAQAAYEFTNVDPPGATFTQLWGINNSGQAVGNAETLTGDISFLYNSKKRSFTILAPHSDPAELLGVNESRVTVGSSDDGIVYSGLIRSRAGGYTSFSHPDCNNTHARAVSTTGLVSGYADTCTIGANTVGFIYDPASGNFTNFLPSPLTIAQGINGRGQVVGSTFVDAGGAYLGSPPGFYGFLRETTGAITLFRVNGLQTRARGITDSGLIAGFADEGSVPKGFVVSLSAGPGYQSVTIPATELLSYPSPNVVETFVQGISNSGVIAGAWTEFLGGDPNDEANYTYHGFIATPPPPKKK